MFLLIGIVPVVAIGVRSDHRRRGIGISMMERLAERAVELSVPTLSLCVSKDNAALSLYRRCGYREYRDIGKSLIMMRDTPPTRVRNGD